MRATTLSEHWLDESAGLEHDAPGRSEQPPLRQYLRVLRRSWWLILLAVIAAVGAAAGWSYTTPTEYRAGMKLVVGQNGGILQSFGGSPEPFTQTMSGLLESDIVALEVADELGLGLPTDRFLERLDVTSQPESTVLDVTYTSPARAQPVAVLEELGRVFPRILRQRLAATPSEGDDTGARLTATVFDPPRLEPTPVAPRPLRNMAIAGALGLLLGLGLAVVREAMAPADRR